MAIETTDTSTQEVANSQTSTNLNTINENAINAINTQYDKNIESSKLELEKAYNENVASLDSSQAKLADTYQGQKNQLAAQYEINKRNQNMQAAVNGLNTGANSQMQLGLSNSYLSAYNDLGKSEAEANKDIETQRQTLLQSYNSDIAKAAADGDAQRAAALLDEYNNQRTNMMSQAAALANYGDFSIYEQLYGTEQAQLMQKGWAMQNPDVAWSLGYLTAAEYKALTGQNPNLMSGNIDESGYFTGQNSITSSNSGSSGSGYAGYPDTRYNILVDGKLTSALYDTNSGLYKYYDSNNNAQVATSTNVTTKKGE